MSQQHQEVEYVKIFDTTLRDGEQSPGFAMNREQKLRLAAQLDRLGVDVIELGYPGSSQGDFDSVQQGATLLKNAVPCGLARTIPEDIKSCAQALGPRGRIHIFISTSPIHMDKKLNMTAQEVLDLVPRMVELGKKTNPDIEFSCEDATRSDWEFLLKVYQAAIDAGANTLNIPDTVGYTTPQRYFNLIKYLIDNLTFGSEVVFSTHCHDDLGLAVANSLAGVEAGARQIECTINGIGERAGNASLDEIAMNYHPQIRQGEDALPYRTRIVHELLYPTSQLLTALTGVEVQPNKAIVGANAFAHASGVHQDGMIKDERTYEIIRPENVGVPSSKLVLTKNSGRKAFAKRLEELGCPITDKEVFNQAFREFKNIADEMTIVPDPDIYRLAVAALGQKREDRFCLLDYHLAHSLNRPAIVWVKIKDRDCVLEATQSAIEGPVTAIIEAIKNITSTEVHMDEYKTGNVSSGTKSEGMAHIVAHLNGRSARGYAVERDIITASAQAYLQVLNHLDLFGVLE